MDGVYPNNQNPSTYNRKNRILNKKQLPTLTTDYDVFLERNEFVYEILDNLEIVLVLNLIIIFSLEPNS